jgi:serine/threonine protein kinase
MEYANITNNLAVDKLVLHTCARNCDYDRLLKELKEIQNYSNELNIIDNKQTVLDIILSDFEPTLDLADLIEYVKILGGKTYSDIKTSLLDRIEMTEQEAFNMMQKNMENKCFTEALKIRKKILVQSYIYDKAVQKCKNNNNATIVYEVDFATRVVCHVGLNGFYNVNIIYSDIIIGKGQEGTIYASHNLLDDNYDKINVAKIIKITPGSKLKIDNEIDMIFNCEIGYDNTFTDEYYYIFMKYGGVSLAHLPKHIPLILKKKIGISLLKEFHKLHYNHILHRDVKPDNVLILLHMNNDNSFSVEITICDYGNSCYMRDSDQDFVGSPAYQPHEFHLLNRPIYSIQTEGYGIGILLCNLFSNEDYDFYQSKKDRLDDYLASDVQNAFPDLFPDDEYFTKIKNADICLYIFIKTIHSLCNENINNRPIFKNYKVFIEKLEKLIFSNKYTLAVTFSNDVHNVRDTDIKEKKRYTINGFFSALSGSDGTTSSPKMSPNQSPKKVNSVTYSPKKTNGTVLAPRSDRGGKKLVASRRTRSASSAEQVRRHEEK